MMTTTTIRQLLVLAIISIVQLFHNHDHRCSYYGHGHGNVDTGLLEWSSPRVGGIIVGVSSFVVVPTSPRLHRSSLSSSSLSLSSSVNGVESTSNSGATTTTTTATTATSTTNNNKVEIQQWYDATVLNIQPACPSGKSVIWTVQVDGPSLSSSSSSSSTTTTTAVEETTTESTIPKFEYTDPGQFVYMMKTQEQTGSDSDESSLLVAAMCSPPSYDEPNKIELLVKKDATTTTTTTTTTNDIVEGSKIYVSQPQGGLASSIATILEESLTSPPPTNVPADEMASDDDTDDDDTDTDNPSSDVVDDTRIDHLVLVASGCGIAPIMSCIREGGGWLPNSVSFVSLYYGEATMDDICFQQYLFPPPSDTNNDSDDESDKEDESTSSTSSSSSTTPNYHNPKIYTIPCLSQQPRDFTKGIWSGRVQNVMWSRGIVNPEKTLAVICGMEEMEQDVTQLLKRAGVDEGRIVSNDH